MTTKAPVVSVQAASCLICARNEQARHCGMHCTRGHHVPISADILPSNAQKIIPLSLLAHQFEFDVQSNGLMRCTSGLALLMTACTW